MKYLITLFVLSANLAFGSEPKAKVSYDDFKSLVAVVEEHREERRIDFDTFLKMSKEPNVIILDSRSAFRYERIHVKGAKHLAFSDFTQDDLARIIPSFDTKILIYCNNNFEGNQVDFMSKIASPPSPVVSELAAQKKPLMMALNIPTYINLYGYGYRNVYELNELVRIDDPRVEFEGTEARVTKALSSLSGFYIDFKETDHEAFSSFKTGQN